MAYERRPLNLHPVYPDDNMGPIDRVDGYNAHIGHSFRLARQEMLHRWGIRFQRLSQWLENHSKDKPTDP